MLRILVDRKGPVDDREILEALDAQEVGKSSRDYKHVNRTARLLEEAKLAEQVSWGTWRATAAARASCRSSS